ncbi:MAG: pyridoxamine 5'-phosphate oxidase [Candidatus Omnitrophica bacterium CG11_big_fil_rev_8_21_14_0_20_45_26]|uniref:Pyridoxamine 5'-phosphate oxidase n=1 Tax=Candidatus Abzuiibacterium crystallinum TaxID=1974748 RepID=A0A2H0LTZ8_9BACT|nr:MAG: pyridoxamine 5'-phosphate oxidase [Candidatus Omnitrophica bacterium CG11_big_fil_rev_8_21_14_0_20_45_26]PIW65585.1 MAG: pyridoxamine 5'-phosphate oxidase [Candidatus Omnitrophica bacterium CG12_big_fil_rev_8_21_14_0_65_45_16]
MNTLDPILECQKALERAEKKGLPLANGMALATCDKQGKPAVRLMLLKHVDERGFVFYTNLNSRKGAELLKNPHAAISFWWPTLEQQIRAEGKVESVSDTEADAYFATRPRGSQLGAWASKQSKTLTSRETLLAEYKKVEQKFKGKQVPRPAHWSGFLLIPERIEFWYGKSDRLHERVLYSRQAGSWKQQLLYP